MQHNPMPSMLQLQHLLEQSLAERRAQGLPDEDEEEAMEVPPRAELERLVEGKSEVEVEALLRRLNRDNDDNVQRIFGGGTDDVAHVDPLTGLPQVQVRNLKHYFNALVDCEFAHLTLDEMIDNVNAVHERAGIAQRVAACAFCARRIGTLRCGGRGCATRYCGKACQRLHWRAHRGGCGAVVEAAP